MKIKAVIRRLRQVSLRMTGFLSILLVTQPLFGAEPSAPVSAPAIDPLTEALPILQAKYIDFKELQFKDGDKLGDLIIRSNGKIGLLASKTDESSPILTALLPGNIIYWRMATFTPQKDWIALASDLNVMISLQQVTGAVLDLRSNLAPDDYAGAAQVAALFAPQDKALSQYLPQKTNGVSPFPLAIPNKQFQGPLIVLINHQTTGAAEVLATCLKADGALIIGQATAGNAGLFEQQKLSSGQILRYMVGQVTLSDSQPLWGKPVTADLSPQINDQVEKHVLALIQDNHVLDVIQESTPRHRLSEATLVQGEDPEWDTYLASLQKKAGDHSAIQPPVRDAALIDAMASLKAIRLSQRPEGNAAPMEAKSQTSASLE